MTREFEYNKQTKELIVKIKSEIKDRGIKRDYKDTFSKEATKKLMQGMNNKIKSYKVEIERTKAEITNLDNQIKNVEKEVKLSPKLRKLVEDLKIIKRYEPAENARIRKEQLEEELKNPKELLKELQDDLSKMKKCLS